MLKTGKLVIKTKIRRKICLIWHFENSNKK
jgi:hypothetical protein